MIRLASHLLAAWFGWKLARFTDELARAVGSAGL